MVSRGGGAILNVSSIAALRGQGGRGNTAYAASKAGLLGLTTDLADVFGKDGIRVNCVAPGILDTPMRNQTMLSRGIDPKSIDLSARTSLGVEGDAWDLARAALFLVGPDGAYITGVLLPVDGGSTARSH
jgi:NAD(P)-dependent dehydrogenase (short-subunit alcohol dehydrogenase family)